MSFWSAVGLADRKALENLMLQMQELRNENQELRSENQRLFGENRMMIFEQMQNQHEQAMQGQKAEFADIRQNINEKHSQDKQEFQLFEGAFKKLNTGLDTLQSALRGQEDSILGAVVRAEESAGNHYDGLVAGIELIQRGQERIVSEMGEQSGSIRKAMGIAAEKQESVVRKAFDDTVAKQRTAIQKAFDDTVAKQRTAIQKAFDDTVAEQRIIIQAAALTIKEGQESLAKDIVTLIQKNECLAEDMERQAAVLREMSGQFEIANREFKDIRKRHENVVHSDEQWLERLEKLSNDFVVLHREQLKSMEYLSQICLNSDQFMEIQKSINDMWEIMKVVWVDSLLDELGKSEKSLKR